MYHCDYCGQTLELNCKQFGAHKTNCSENPNKQANIEKQADAQRYPRKEYSISCRVCKNDFFVVMTEQQYVRGRYRKTCSALCAGARHLGESSRQRISASLKGRYRGQLTDGLKDIICSVCGNFVQIPKHSIAKTCGPDCSKKLRSSRLKGKTGGYRVRSGTSKFHGSYYNEIWMDSSWERMFAELADLNNIKWVRSTTDYFLYKDSQGKIRKYYPDFLLPMTKQYVEIKGYWVSESIHKMNQISTLLGKNLVILESQKEILEFFK